MKIIIENDSIKILENIISEIPHKHALILLEFINARVVHDEVPKENKI
jgi:hypothetical protein